MAMKLYVGNLSYNVADQELNDFFANEGKVVSAAVVKDKRTGQSKGFGFVEMEDIKEGQNAIKALDGKELDGRAIMVNQARATEERRHSSSYNNGKSSGRRPY